MDKKEWLDDHAVTSAVPFDLVDATGSVRVEPTGADWSLENDYEHLVEEGVAPTGPHAEFVAQEEVYLMDDEGISEAHELKFVERRLEPDDEITVFGPLDDSGLERRIHAEDGWFTGKLFSIADRRDDLTVTVGAGIITLLFGLVFTAGGLWFARLGFL
ncbi:GIDE domain-containing protein [Halomicroarcula sp. GCM10025894]|uniref:GIDE domain-containing protein n=1 Tax=Halomicroarcula sp. GCM10025894 TaxID=3252673 RepID=UPI00360B6577